MSDNVFLSAPPDTRLLLVEDDTEIGESLEEYFQIRGYTVERVDNGEAALRKATSLPPYDLILLDVLLPEKDGFAVLREARRSGVDSPIIMLTVKSDPKHKLRGFDLGADDYVTKPFDLKELAARVRAVLNRTQSGPSADEEVYQFDDVTVNLTQETATRQGEAVGLTDLEFMILAYFINHRGRTVSRKQLLRDVWGISGDVTTRTIDRHVAALRKKIEPDPEDPTYIETVYGIGYKFVE